MPEARPKSTINTRWSELEFDIKVGRKLWGSFLIVRSGRPEPGGGIRFHIRAQIGTTSASASFSSLWSSTRESLLGHATDALEYRRLLRRLIKPSAAGETWFAPKPVHHRQGYLSDKALQEAFEIPLLRER